MKFISTHGCCYLVYGLLVSGYFLAAAVGRWPAPVMPESDGAHSGGSSYGRSSGGSWGGGK